MGQTENVEKAPKTSWFDGVKAEFKKSHLAGTEISCQTDHCSDCYIRCSRSYYCTAGLGNSARCEFPCWFEILTEA